MVRFKYKYVALIGTAETSGNYWVLTFRFDPSDLPFNSRSLRVTPVETEFTVKTNDPRVMEQFELGKVYYFQSIDPEAPMEASPRT